MRNYPPGAGPLMVAALGQLEPLPGIGYTPTMHSADIYPSHVGIGGVRTQDYTIPAFSEAITANRSAAIGTAGLPGGLFSTPAGWLFIAALVVLVVSVRHGRLPRVYL